MICWIKGKLSNSQKKKGEGGEEDKWKAWLDMLISVALSIVFNVNWREKEIRQQSCVSWMQRAQQDFCQKHSVFIKTASD